MKMECLADGDDQWNKIYAAGLKQLCLEAALVYLRKLIHAAKEIDALLRKKLAVAQTKVLWWKNM